MTTINVTLRTGEEREVDVGHSESVMEAIRDGGIDEILAICGGCCSCATCHVYVDPVSGANVSPPGSDESDMLEFIEHRTDQSRLSCQIRIGAETDGLRVTIAPEG